ncbi:MAG: glycan-binding surface protein [Tannerellaceae bacterium]|nr:glycan-binding surface protein [Tannerellaceae bacterium]
MKILNIKTTYPLLLLVTSILTSCQDIVTYNDNYDDGMASYGPPVIHAIYASDDRGKTQPIATGAFEDIIVLQGENLSHVKKVTFNDIEVPVTDIYATAKNAYIPIPRKIPGEVNNKLYYQTEQGNTSTDFTVTIPGVKIEGLYNEFALPGDTVQLTGNYFDLYGFGGQTPTSTIQMNGIELVVDSLSEQYMSVIIPQNAPENTIITISYEGVNGTVITHIPYRHTQSVIWDLSQPGNYGFWAGTELITTGQAEHEPDPLHGSYLRIAGSYSAWSWNNLLCGGFNMPAEIAANPENYNFKFEVCSPSGNPFYDSGSAGYLIQLNNGQYTWNPSAARSFNTYGQWCTVSVELTDIATNGLSGGWTSLNWILQPNADWNLDHSFANIRIEKKIK